MGPTALLPFQRKSYLGFLCSEKIHQPQPGLNLRASDPVASMITTGPPGSTFNRRTPHLSVSAKKSGQSYQLHFKNTRYVITFSTKTFLLELSFIRSKENIWNSTQFPNNIRHLWPTFLFIKNFSVICKKSLTF